MHFKKNKSKPEDVIRQIMKASEGKPSVLSNIDQEQFNEMLINHVPKKVQNNTDFRSGMLDGFKPS